MARIKVLGGTGFAGEAVVREAAGRGHEVTSYSRRSPSEPVDGVAYVNGSLLDPELLATTVENADVVFETISPRGDMEGRVEEIVDQLIRLADDSGVRLGVLGGVSSVSRSPRSYRRSRPDSRYWRRSRSPLRRSTGSTSVQPPPSVPGTPSKSPVTTALVTMYC